VREAGAGGGRRDRPRPTSSTTEAGLLSHGQKQWLEIGMLLMQDPELLMLDEPIAGMSVRERELTAELLERICKNRSVIVIEHDMEFVKRIAHKVTVMHQGKILAEGRWTRCRPTPRSSTSISATESGTPAMEPTMLNVKDVHVAYGQSEALHGISFEARERDRRHHGPQRHGQDHAVQVADRHAAAEVRPHRGRRQGPLEGRELPARGQGHRLRAAGPDDLSRPDGEENIQTGLENAKVKRFRKRSMRCFRCCSTCAAARAATCPAASSSSWRSPAHW
jgi:hypothetical protein